MERYRKGDFKSMKKVLVVVAIMGIVGGSIGAIATRSHFSGDASLVYGQVVDKIRWIYANIDLYQLTLKLTYPLSYQHSITDNAYVYQFFSRQDLQNIEIGDNVILYYEEEKWDLPDGEYRTIPFIRLINRIPPESIKDCKIILTVIPSSAPQTTVRYHGTSFKVDNGAIQSDWQTSLYYYFTVKNDGTHPVNLKMAINGVINGPVPSSNWGEHGNDWLGAVLWSYSENRWIGHTELDITGIIFHLGRGENKLIRVTFNFQNERAFKAGSWFPGNPQVQFKFSNADTNEVYWTPTLSWWTWGM